MTLFASSMFCGLALLFAALSSAAPSSLVNNEQPLHHAFVDEPFNIASAPANTAASTLEKRGYDPSTEWQRTSTVEIWSGGSNSAPVNYGDLRGSNLSDTIFTRLNVACPASTGEGSRGCCPGSPQMPTEWRSFFTNALVNGDPWWEVQLRQPWVRIQQGCFRDEGVRVVLLQLVAEALAAYTLRSDGYNCYEIPGTWKGHYRNVPHVVNLPNTKDDADPLDFLQPTYYNYMYIETWSSDATNQFGFTKGQLRPCKTCALIDDVMDKYEKDICDLFPEWNNWFSRDAKVILNGYKVCSNEP
ncbi:hypothetical protein OPT61_g10388 [Boeremia exigua]|uniref:Uncharacterized protein n=1 Tax=Boeremia exigua TaxID=749465 RepID=A0ACC2HRC8_9PLEO|nr:hypothetical protein OPT61_g10388 [Boeremia exigua]